MMILEWITLFVAVSLIVTSILFLVLLRTALKIKQEIKAWEKKKPKKRSRSKRWRRRQRNYQQRLKRTQKGMLSLVFMMFVVTLAGFFGYDYQLRNISQMDSENIVKSVALLAELEEQLVSPKEKESAQKRAANYQQITVKLASYTSKNPAYGSSEEGRRLIKRYYMQIGELGINASSQNYKDLIASESLQSGYLADIAKVKESEKKVFEFYHLNLKSK